MEPDGSSIGFDNGDSLSNSTAPIPASGLPV